MVKSAGSRFTGSLPWGRSAWLPDPVPLCARSASAFGLLFALVFELQPAVRRTSAMAMAWICRMTWTSLLTRRLIAGCLVDDVEFAVEHHLNDAAVGLADLGLIGRVWVVALLDLEHGAAARGAERCVASPSGGYAGQRPVGVHLLAGFVLR